MKVIVSYWVYPYEVKSPKEVDSRPKSIERVSTSVDELRKWLHKVHSSESVEARFISGKTLHCISDRANEFDKSQLFGQSHHYKDCFDYLESLLRQDLTGICFCRIKGCIGEYYYGFQVRNLH